MTASTGNHAITDAQGVLLSSSTLVASLDLACRVTRAPAGQAAVAVLLDGVRTVVPAEASCLVVMRSASAVARKRLQVMCVGPMAETSPGLAPMLESVAHSVASAGHSRADPHKLDGGELHALPALAEPAGCRRVALLAVRALKDPFTLRDSTLLQALACAVADPVVAAADRLEDMLDHFNARQRDVLMQLCSGASEKEIASRIGRSHHTVHSYVKAIYRQLGVTSRAELIARLMRAEATHTHGGLDLRLSQHDGPATSADSMDYHPPSRRSHRRRRAGTTPA